MTEKETTGKAILAANKPPIDFWFQAITPSDAQTLLGKNFDNRNLSPAVVNRYVEDMRGGRWVLTHQGIAVDPDGGLVDGQHRLAAIVKAAVTITLLMGAYRDHEQAAAARQACDLGRARRTGDILEIGKVVERGVGKRYSAITTALMVLDTSEPTGGWTAATVRTRLDKERAAINFAVSLPPRLFPAPIAAAFAYAWPVAKDEVSQFAQLVSDKVGYDPGSAPHLYVQAVDRGSIALSLRESSKDRRVQASHLVLRLLQAHVEGETIAKLQASTKGLEFFRARRERAQ